MSSAAQAAKLDLGERVSYVSSTTKGKDGEYVDASTPGVLEDGALRAGGRPDVWSKDYIGLLFQYMAVGLVYGTLPSMVYPVLQVYLNMEGTQTTSASVLLVLPWSFKALYGVITDCFPIFGYRRRPFMILGWTLCCIMLLIMACSKVGRPYYPDRHVADRLAKTSPKDYTPADAAIVNTHAPDVGGKFIVLMMLAAVGYVGSDVAADAMVVELAQREPEAVRGTIQTTIYMVRTIFVSVSLVFTAFLFNGKEYGGDFSFSLTFPQLMVILLCMTAPVIPITWFFIKEDKHPGIPIKTYLLEFWELVQTRAMYQILTYTFFTQLLSNFSSIASGPIQNFWVKATPLSTNVSSLIGNLVFAFVLWATARWGLHWNWRWTQVITLVSAYSIDAIITFIVIWDGVRDQWFWLGPPIVEQVPLSVSFIVGTYVFVELAGEGNEGAMYGLLTTTSNLAGSFASTITKQVDSNFDVTNKDIQNDTTHVRKQVTYVYIIMYIVKLSSFALLPLLPPQKKETQILKAKGGKSKIIGAMTLVVLAFSLVWSVMVNILSIFESTACLKIAGGDGC